MLSIAALLETLYCELVPSIITTTLWRKYVTIPILQTRELSQREVKWLPQGHMCAQSLSPVWLFTTPWTVARRTPLSMEFSRQEYWNGLPSPSPGDLPEPGIEPLSLESPALAGRFFSTTWLFNRYFKFKMANRERERERERKRYFSMFSCHCSCISVNCPIMYSIV